MQKKEEIDLKTVLNKDFFLFLVLNFFISLSLGIFLLVFNLHIVTVIGSKLFLGNFLFLGNVSMAVGGIFLGKYIDVYSKKKVLIATTITCSVLFGVEICSVNPNILYVVSVLYGFSFSLYLSIGTPFILEYVEGKNQKLATSVLSSTKLAGTTIGTWIAGGLSSIDTNNYLNVLFLAVVFYACSIIPAFLITEKVKAFDSSILESKANRSAPTNHFINKKYIMLAGVYTCLGLLIFLSPYMNLYLEMRYEISILLLSGFLSLISLIPIATNILLAKLTANLKMSRVISVSLILVTIVYVLLFIVDNLYIQMILILISSIITAFVFPLINIYILKKYQHENQGKISGHINFWYNAGDAIGTYSEGIFLANQMFKVSFGIASLLYMSTLICIKKYENIENK